MDFSKVLYTGNFIRFNPYNCKFSNQNQNIRWMYEIVSAHIDVVLNLPSDLFVWESDDNNIYHKLGLEVNLKNYLDIYSGLYNDRLRSYFDTVFSDAFVVGFELPPFLVDYFNDVGIGFVDLVISPLRFFNDLVIGCRSNVKAICQQLAFCQVSDFEIDAYARLKKATFQKKNKPAIENGAAIFVGQVRFDTSQIVGNKFACLEDYLAEIKNIKDGYKNFYYKPHPYSLNKDVRDDFKVLKKLGLKYTDINIYSLLSSGMVQAVYSLSSSVSVESNYFGVKGYTLLHYPFNYGVTDILEGRFYNTYGKVHTTSFWEGVFNKAALVEVDIPIGCLSRSMGLSWGGDESQKDFGGWFRKLFR